MWNTGFEPDLTMLKNIWTTEAHFELIAYVSLCILACHMIPFLFQVKKNKNACFQRGRVQM